MRVLAIGDIHGCSTALEILLDEVKPVAGDLVVTLGDYLHRGPDSAGVLDHLIDLRLKGRLVPIRGNHEQMALEMEDRDVEGFTPSHWRFLEEALVDWYEIDTHFFVHANAYPDVPLFDQPDYMLRWEALVDPRPHVSGKVMVCGHTPQKNGFPLNLGHTICIDTYAYGSGWLTCLDVKTGQYWQANQRGHSRAGRLVKVD